MHEKLLDSRTERLFRESFVKIFRENMNSGGLSEEGLADYFNSPEFKKLNQQCRGLGYAYFGLVIHKLLDAYKVRYENGRYFNGSGGIDSSLDENLTHKDRRVLARVLSHGLECYPGAGEIQAASGS